MSPSTVTQVKPATAAEIAELRRGVEHDLGSVLTPISKDSLRLSSEERADVHESLRRKGLSVLEITAKVNLSFINRKMGFDQQVPGLAALDLPKGAREFAGQRFWLHACNGLEFNFRDGFFLSASEPVIDQHSTNAFFMGRSAREGSDGDPITNYAGPGFSQLLARQRIPVSERMEELDSKRVLLAIDLAGYENLRCDPAASFLAFRDKWCLIAACPPPSKFIHILGEIQPDDFGSSLGQFRDGRALEE